MGFHLVPPFVILVALFTQCSYTVAGSAPFNTHTDGDKKALLSFKASITSDPSNTLTTWNQSSTLCNWEGVFCDQFKQRVIGLDLHDRTLTGIISPYIGNLSFLNFLLLQNNMLSGALPDQIGNLSRLRILNVSSNFIEGVIPPNMSQCLELEVLDITSNEISGQIPPVIGFLSKLEFMGMSKNQLTGAIPPSIGNISSLTTLQLATNYLCGTIPSDLGHLRNLKCLQISLNNLTGTVPASLYNVSSLVTFGLSANQLWGELPNDVGFMLPNLLAYHVCFNHFTGTVPQSLNNITNIQSIRLSHNFLVGSVPRGLENLNDLQLYNFGFNQIVSSGDSGLNFITSLTNSTKLKLLAFDENLLEGVIPKSIGNLSTSLMKLFMGGNRIYGTIPASISRLSSLALLNLSSNMISGEIPSEIGQLKELQVLGLTKNQISGKIPTYLGNLSILSRLEISGNYLEGSIPQTFGKYQRLLLLDLSKNNLSGSIPREVFTLSSLSSFLNLSKNSLSGPVPQEIGMLQNIATIDISNNQLSGSIPYSIGNCKSLQELYIANNFLSGPISNAFGEVKGLQTLDLSSNRFSGTIPDNLSKLKALQFLNLSFNDLEGEIPTDGVFSDPSRVHLEGNSRLCISCPCNRSQLPLTHRRRSIVLQIILATVGSVTLCLIIGLLWILFYRRKDRAKVIAISDSFSRQQCRMVSYEELLTGTNDFNQSNLIGSGSFGSVYRGSLKDGMCVAVKVLDLERKGASKSFLAECEALRNVRHRNLVKLITPCSIVGSGNASFRALVYEFMSNGSLEEWIHRKRKHGNGDGLNFLERLNIAIDVACAMEYLHHDCETPVVHCDLKPSNVLLDKEMTAKVGDFGIARLLVDECADQQSTSHMLKGSVGYIPPEYGLGRKPSTSGDVYSYGVMLLELFTGKSPTHSTFVGDLTLPKWVHFAFFSNKILEVVDPELLESMSHHHHQHQDRLVSGCILIIRVVLFCVSNFPDARISMRDVLYQLKDIRDTFIEPLSSDTATMSMQGRPIQNESISMVTFQH